MAGIVKILLQRKEESLACYMTAFYKIDLDSDLINRAVKGSYFEWFKYLWAFKQNKFMVDSKEGKANTEFNFIMLFLKIMNKTDDDYIEVYPANFSG